MRKKSAIMASAIAVVLTTSLLVFALPNQVFAQAGGHGGWLFGHSGLLGQTNVKVLGALGNEGILGSHPDLGNNPTPYPTPIPGEETQLGKILGNHPGLGCSLRC